MRTLRIPELPALVTLRANAHIVDEQVIEDIDLEASKEPTPKRYKIVAKSSDAEKGRCPANDNQDDKKQRDASIPCEVTLLHLALPNALVQMKVPAGLLQMTVFAEQLQHSEQAAELMCKPAELAGRPYKEAKSDPKAKWECDPEMMNVMQDMARWAMHTVERRAAESIAFSTVHHMSAAGDKVAVFQTRATRAFKAGSYILAPVGGTFSVDCPSKVKPVPVVSHGLYEACCQIVVKGQKYTGPSVERAAHLKECKFNLTSPFLLSKMPDMVAPFWASTKIASDANMKPDFMILPIEVPKITGDKDGGGGNDLRGYKWSVAVPIFTNRKAINAADLITLPIYSLSS